MINSRVERVSLLWFQFTLRKIISICSFGIQKYFSLQLNCSYKYTWFIRYHISRVRNIDLIYTNSVLGLQCVGLLKHKGLKIGYDIEDAFPYVGDNLCVHTLEIERKYILQCDFFTIASPFYRDLYINLYNVTAPFFLVLNVFPEFDSNINEKGDKCNPMSISLYWVSQTIGLDRGLQDIFSVFHELDTSFELHLRGNVTRFVKSELIKILKDSSALSRVFFHPFVSQDIFRIRMREHDIGLALEPGFGLNNEIAVSNKIFDYLSCGLTVVASDTKGHNYVFEHAMDKVVIYERGDADSLLSAINCASKAKSMKYEISLPSEFSITKAYEQLNCALGTISNLP